MLLSGKTALVTGASRGVGRAIAERFAAEGAYLLLAARNSKLLEEVAAVCKAKGSPGVEVFETDLAVPEDVQALVDKVIVKHAKGVDVLVNCAGILCRGTCDEGDPSLWEKIIAVNLSAPMRLIRGFSPLMKANNSGTIINISSNCGVEPFAPLTAYVASKWGLRGFCLSCHESLKEHHVRVMLIHPSLIATDMSSDLSFDRSKVIQPQEIAEACMIPFKLGPGCVPTELVLRNGKSVF